MRILSARIFLSLLAGKLKAFEPNLLTVKRLLKLKKGGKTENIAQGVTT